MQERGEPGSHLHYMIKCLHLLLSSYSITALSASISIAVFAPGWSGRTFPPPASPADLNPTELTFAVLGLRVGAPGCE